jgi:hypothetical protein
MPTEGKNNLVPDRSPEMPVGQDRVEPLGNEHSVGEGVCVTRETGSKTGLVIGGKAKAQLGAEHVEEPINFVLG